MPQKRPVLKYIKDGMHRLTRPKSEKLGEPHEQYRGINIDEDSESANLEIIKFDSSSQAWVSLNNFCDGLHLPQMFTYPTTTLAHQDVGVFLNKASIKEGIASTIETSYSILENSPLLSSP